MATNRTIDENTDTQKKSAEPVTRVPKFSTIIAGIIVMVILVCMALAFSDGSSTEKLQQYLKNKEYSNAVQFYNKKVNGNEKREKEVNPLFSSSVEGIFFDFQEDEISYEEIIRIYEELVKVENQELAELTALKIEEVNEFQESREIFETGVGLLETREYISALETFAKIEKSPYYYAQVQEQMERCVEDIVRSVSDKTDMENIKDSFEIIKKALKILPGNDSLTKCQTELGANFKKNLFEQTEKLVQAGDYAGVFSAIKKAMNVFSDADILAKKEQYESDFELKMVEEVNDFVNKGQYAEALKVIEDALKVMNSNTLKNLKNDIQAKQAEVKEKEAQHISEKVDFVTCEGSINGADEVHTYSLTAPETGSYRFFLKDMKNGFTVKLYVYTADGAEIGGHYSLGNNGGVTCKLEAGKEYVVKVTAKSETGSYTLNIGQQKQTIDISEKDIIFDSIEYTDQQNVYVFTPQETGIYRFDLSNMINGFHVKLYIYDSLGYEIAGHYSLGNQNGITAKMEAGQQYTICIIQRDDGGKYNLTIGKQIPTQNITGISNVSNAINYRDQCIVYKYTPASSGTYKFKLSNMANEFRIKFYVYDSLGYEVGGNYAAGNGAEITAELKTGEIYEIIVTQRDNFGHYRINISR